MRPALASHLSCTICVFAVPTLPRARSLNGEDLAVGEMDKALVGRAAEAELKGTLGNDEATVNEPINLVEQVLAFGLFPELLKGPAGIRDDIQAQAMAPTGKMVKRLRLTEGFAA